MGADDLHHPAHGNVVSRAIDLAPADFTLSVTTPII
jgi:hypothetical protein